MIALVGSGEFLPVMEEVDRKLLEGRPQRAIFLPTAAALEGEDRIDYWVQLGLGHYDGMGVDAEPLLVLDRDHANDDRYAAKIEGAGLIYLSGGNPAYLVDTLRDSAVWQAIVAAYENGAALAGCSAGAIALTAVVRDRLSADAPLRPALALLPQLAVLPHFDRFRRFFPEVTQRRYPDGMTVIGVDEDTAIVGGPERWTVMGRQSAWVLGEEEVRYDAGSSISVA